MASRVQTNCKQTQQLIWESRLANLHLSTLRVRSAPSPSYPDERRVLLLAGRDLEEPPGSPPATCKNRLRTFAARLRRRAIAVVISDLGTPLHTQCAAARLAAREQREVTSPPSDLVRRPLVHVQAFCHLTTRTCGEGAVRPRAPRNGGLALSSGALTTRSGRRNRLQKIGRSRFRNSRGRHRNPSQKKERGA